MKTINRRRFLTSTMAAIGLPYLESFAKNESPTKDARTFVAIGSFFGWHREDLYPRKGGKNYALPKLIEPIAAHRNDFTIFSGLDHKANHGHENWPNFLCGTAGDYSLDQMIADKIGQKSRFPLYATRRWGSGRPGRYDELYPTENPFAHDAPAQRSL